jgi:HD-GYP domain-containing protein (c-di-GMP phosphodiesterase class II)
MRFRKNMQRHAQIGFDLVKDIAFLSDAAELVLSHHERHDGGGYPRGLQGDEILPSARIFAVADSFDAITSDRPYRRASSFESGLQIIRDCSGTQFDPQVVTAFFSIPAENWQAIANHQRQLAPRPSDLRVSRSPNPPGPGTLP